MQLHDTAKLAVLLVCGVLFAPELAQACAVCGAGQQEDTRLAFILTTAFLTFLPLSMMGGAVWWLRRRVRRFESSQLEMRPVDAAPLSRASSSR